VHDACRLACEYALSGKSARKQLQLKFDRKFGLFSSFWKFGRFLKGTFLKKGSFFVGRKRVDLEWNFEFSFWKLLYRVLAKRSSFGSLAVPGLQERIAKACTESATSEPGCSLPVLDDAFNEESCAWPKIWEYAWPCRISCEHGVSRKGNGRNAA
jgi:hypothetical protein